MAMSLSARRHILLAVSGLVVAYVRQVVQYHAYSWETITQFLVSWFVHYIGVAFLAALACFFINRTQALFFSRDSHRPALDIDDALVYVSIVALVAAIAIFVLAHWVAIEGND
jgi:hypothetical protein